MPALLILANQSIRDKAKHWIDRAPVNARVSFDGPKRSLEQNNKLWAVLTDIADQKLYHGLKLLPGDYKLIFMQVLNSEVRIVPNLDGNGFVNLGRSTSKLSKAEFSDLLEIITAWAAKEGVVFSEPARTEEVA